MKHLSEGVKSLRVFLAITGNATACVNRSLECDIGTEPVEVGGLEAFETGHFFDGMQLTFVAAVLVDGLCLIEIKVGVIHEALHRQFVDVNLLYRLR